MRIFKRGKVYYVEFQKDKRVSLGTTNKREAHTIANELQKRFLLKKVRKIQKAEGIQEYTLSEFCSDYVTNIDRSTLSPETHRADKMALNLLVQSVGDLSLSDITDSHLSKFKSDCLARKVKPVSINLYLRHLKASLSYAKKHKHIKEIPDFTYFKLPKSLPRAVSSSDIALILKASEIKPEMNRIIRFTLYTGCRRAELISLLYDNIIQQDKILMIKIVGKGNKERIVPIVGDALEVLGTKTTGKVFSYQHVSTISNYFRRIVRSCGVTAKFHDLRHTAATQMLNRGISIEIVQKMLGHEEIRTTQIYAQMSGKTLAEEMAGKMGY
jgi:site-specific recombinase XerD